MEAYELRSSLQLKRKPPGNLPSEAYLDGITLRSVTGPAENTAIMIVTQGHTVCWAEGGAIPDSPINELVIDVPWGEEKCSNP